jgi:hypothetical protein
MRESCLEGGRKSLNTHEDFTRKEVEHGPSNRSFGWVFAVFFALVGVWPAVHHRGVRLWALAVAAAFAFVTIAKPEALGPANRLWMRLGLLLGRVVNPIVTALLFYLVITPIAFLLRLAGNDPMRLRRDPQSSTYWIERNPPGPPPETMSHQF